jgi:hypothetical protein
MPPFRQARRAGPGPRAGTMSTFALGQMQVRRSGYGAMQLAGPYAFGPPPDRATAIGVLRAAVAAGVDHIDTAQYYGSGVVNGLIRDALWPYPDGLAIVGKVAVRPDGGAVLRSGDPDRLRQGIQDNLRSLRVGQLAAVNLRLPGGGRVDARFDDQLAAMVAARDEGLIAGVGLSNVSLDQLADLARQVRAYDLLRMLGRDGRPSPLGEAFAEYGQIAKTLHLLALADPADDGYRRTVNTQLTVQESRHRLARKIFHGRRDELRQAYREGQEDQLGALGLVLNAVVL